MIYQCNKCNLIHEDDDLECTCGCEDVTILAFCDNCGHLCEIGNMYDGLCSYCWEEYE